MLMEAIRIKSIKLKNLSYSFLFLLPLLLFVGLFFTGYLDNNLLLMLLLAILSVIPLVVAHNKIPTNLYIILLYVISVCLMLHNSLIPNYKFEWADNSWEYFFSNSVSNSGHWISTISSNVAGALSIVIFAPILSVLSGVNVSLIFSVVYPLIFSLIPVLIYKIAEKQTNNKAFSFISGFFIMCFYTYYTTILGLSRFQIASFFLLLLIYVSFFSKIQGIKKSCLIVSFSLLMIVSHYTLAVLFSIILVLGLLINYLLIRFFKKVNESRIWLNPPAILFFVIASLSWFVFISNGSVYNTLVNLGKNIIQNLSYFLSPEKVQGLNVLVGATTTSVGQFTRIFSLISIFIISVGLVAILINKIKVNISTEYFALCLASYIICVFGLTIPNFASSINTDRLFQISLIFLAPFFIIGAVSCYSTLFAKLRRGIYKQSTILKIVSLFIICLFLLNVGFVNEIANEPSSLSLDKRSFSQKSHFDIQDISGAQWLAENIGNYSDLYYQNQNNYAYLKIDSTAYYYSKIHADSQYAYLIMMNHGFYSPLGSFDGKKILSPLMPGEYIFLGTNNVENSIIQLRNPDSPRTGSVLTSNISDTTLASELDLSSKILDNGQAQVFYYQGPPYDPVR